MLFPSEYIVLFMWFTIQRLKLWIGKSKEEIMKQPQGLDCVFYLMIGGRRGREKREMYLREKKRKRSEKILSLFTAWGSPKSCLPLIDFNGQLSGREWSKILTRKTSRQKNSSRVGVGCRYDTRRCYLMWSGEKIAGTENVRQMSGRLFP